MELEHKILAKLNESKKLEDDVEAFIKGSEFTAVAAERQLIKSLDHYFLYFIVSQLDEKNSDNFDDLVSKVQFDSYPEYFKPDSSNFLRRCFSELVLYFMFQKKHIKIAQSTEAKSDLLRAFYIPFEAWILSDDTNKDREKYHVI